jgi:RNA polymerase sigma-70 factor, ECF subfamily
MRMTFWPPRVEGLLAVSDALPDQRLIDAYRTGDEEAARRLFERYYARLIELIRRQLGYKLKEVEGSTDIAQSVLRSFFGRAMEDQVRFGPEDSLWPLLVTITLNKIRNRAKFWQRDRRDRSRQVTLADHNDPLESEPSPQDAAELAELIQQLLEPFPERRRKIIELILEGYGVGEIASMAGTTERTVYNTRMAAAKILEQLVQAEP